ncbi:hypothetical protein [Pseudonocardia sp. ICBG1293]|uniref:hypothetical protein n=1 Tax=Pseudonocardia sp. ICBG1293 TaxID=2844382 RepID=UPI001CCEF245|nr:hypothetical protein [Pseudonocardia sp. ICBG1293]
MSAPHADDRTPARPDGRRNGHPTTVLPGAGPAGGGPPAGTTAPASPTAPAGPPVSPVPVPAPRTEDPTGGPVGATPEPAPEPVELTGPVDIRNRPGPRTPPLPWPAVPAADEPPPGGVPAQRSAPGAGPADRSGGAGPSPAGDPGRPGPARTGEPGPGPTAGLGAPPQVGRGAGPQTPPGTGTWPAPGRWPTGHVRTGPVPRWATGTGPGRAPAPTAPWAAAAPGAGPPGGPYLAAPVPVVYPPGHAPSGPPAGRAAALRDRMSAVRLPGGGLRGAVPHRVAALAVVATLVLAAAAAVASHPGSERADGPGRGPEAGVAPVPAPPDLVAGTTAADPAAFGSPVSFTSPTGNISCRITGGAGDGAVRCDLTSRTWSAGDCPDAALVTGGGSGARTECGGAPVGSGAAVLDYGTRLTEGDITCVSSRAGGECRDGRTGAGFSAARAAYRTY